MGGRGEGGDQEVQESRHSVHYYFSLLSSPCKGANGKITKGFGEVNDQERSLQLPSFLAGAIHVQMGQGGGSFEGG